MEKENSRSGTIFILKPKFEKSTNRIKFYRDLYGHKRYSNYGKYVYIEEGLLSNIPYIKPNKSVIIVSKENSKKLIDFLNKKEIDFYSWEIMLNKKELEEIK